MMMLRLDAGAENFRLCATWIALVTGTTALGAVGVLLVAAAPVSWMSVPAADTAAGRLKTADAEADPVFAT
jgi:hypothetical protein